MLLISISVYAVDTFTAINLLVFDRWSGKIKPVIPLHISRWIFAGCIILSFVLLLHRWMRAIRVMKRDGVAQSYLDPLAVRIQSIRMGKEGRGWKRFLVFAELTKSRKGADYVALFSYYSFEAWLRIVFAEGPRQVINAITLYSVMRLNLLPQGEHAAVNGHSPIGQFFVNIGVLADSNIEQAIVLFAMLWTLIIWVISVLSLIVSIILYIIFLWHHIPSTDNGLSGYCKRKINGRMQKIVRAKVDQALKRENELRARQQAKEGGEFKRQPTLPDVGSVSDEPVLGISRQTTWTTLPEYSSAATTDRENLASQLNGTGPMAGSRPRPPIRSVTQSSDASWTSYSANAPLMSGASEMGYGPPDRAQTPRAASPGPWGSRPPPSRSMTGMSQQSQRSFSPGPGSRPANGQDGRNTPGSFQMEPLSRSGTNMSSEQSRSLTRHPSELSSAASLAQGRSTSANQRNPYFPPSPTLSSSETQLPPYSVRPPDDMQGRRTPAPTNPSIPPYPHPSGRTSPAPSYRSQIPTAPPVRSYTPVVAPTGRSTTPGRAPTLPRPQTSGSMNDNSGGHIAFNPSAQPPVSAPSGPVNRPARTSSRPAMASTASSYSARPGLQSSRSASRNDNQSQTSNHDPVTDILNRY
jgi:Fungal potassium channel